MSSKENGDAKAAQLGPVLMPIWTECSRGRNTNTTHCDLFLREVAKV